MEILINALLVFLMGMIIGSLWFLYCNERAFTQRITLLEAIPDGDEFDDLLDQYLAVSYDKHIWGLFFFQNVKSYYSPELQKLW